MANVVQAFTIPGRLPDLNEIIETARNHWSKSAEQKKTYTDIVFWCAKKAHISKMQRVKVRVTWFEQNAQRDPDNIHAGVKFIMDGLVLAGVIPNDTQRHVASINHAPIQIDRVEPRIEVELEEVEGIA